MNEALTRPGLNMPAALQGLRERLAYRESAGRDIRLDLLRGWCIFSMVVDHAADQRSSPLFTITGNGPWPITGAHGFVLLSGMVIGLLYAPLIERQGIAAALRKLGGRALKLYLVAVGLGIFDLLWSWQPWTGGRPDLSGLGALFLLHMGSDDLMTFYFVLVLLAAPLLILLRRRLWPVALALSIAAWLIHNHDERLLNPPFTYFAPVADWQLLFVAGVALGFHRHQIGGWLRGPLKAVWLVLVFAVFTFTLAVQAGATDLLADTPAAGFLGWASEQGWQGYDHNPPIHMLLVFGDLTALYYLVTWLWGLVAPAVGWFLIPLGQAALYVYIVHQVLVFYVLSATPYFGRLQGTILTAALLLLMLLIWALVKRRFLFSVIPR